MRAKIISNDLKFLNFKFVSSTSQLYSVENLDTVISHPSFSTGRDTVIYHYGFSETPATDSVQDIVNSYVQVDNVNFFLIFYDNLSTNTVANARAIGDALAGAYIRLCDAGQAAARLHLVGFSLGAQIQAIASRNVQSQTNRRLVIGRLTGLDPAQIQSILQPLTGRLSQNDAAFVDSIHTEGVRLGDHESQGHAAFFRQRWFRATFLHFRNHDHPSNLFT